MQITRLFSEKLQGWVVSADSLNVDRSSSGVNTVVHAVNNPNNARGLIGFPVKNINRKKQEAKPTGGRPFNSNESITCAPPGALCASWGVTHSLQVLASR